MLVNGYSFLIQAPKKKISILSLVFRLQCKHVQSDQLDYSLDTLCKCQLWAHAEFNLQLRSYSYLSGWDNASDDSRQSTSSTKLPSASFCITLGASLDLSSSQLIPAFSFATFNETAYGHQDFSYWSGRQSRRKGPYTTTMLMLADQIMFIWLQ